jgi:hypothetical protein
MEIVRLSHARLPVDQLPLLHANTAPTFPAETLASQEQQLSAAAKHYANRWLLGPTASADMQQWEYNLLMQYLFAAHPPHGRVLFLGTARGQAIDAALHLCPTLEWTATCLESSSSPCLFDDHLQAMTLPSGQVCVFRPQCADEDLFTDKHMTAVLAAVTHYNHTIVADALTFAAEQYAFLLRIVFDRLQPGGMFVWRVDNAFVYHQQAILQQLRSKFADVVVATPRTHVSYDIHFLVCTGYHPTYAALDTAVSPALVNDLLDRWLAQYSADYASYVCLAKYFEAAGLTGVGATEAHWAAHASVYNMTALLHTKQNVLV